jgi:tetratricopeptide (TPR) repeat protein
MSPRERLSEVRHTGWGVIVTGIIEAVALTGGCGGSEGPKLSDSSKYLVEARRALGDGDTDAALKALDASIAAEPNEWAYLDRAKLHATLGNDQAALDDCEALVRLKPDNPDVAWIKGELKKPVADRFKGRFAVPPSFTK